MIVFINDAKKKEKGLVADLYITYWYTEKSYCK